MYAHTNNSESVRACVNSLWMCRYAAAAQVKQQEIDLEEQPRCPAPPQLANVDSEKFVPEVLGRPVCREAPLIALSALSIHPGLCVCMYVCMYVCVYLYAVKRL
jgi:hypothetical protein